MVGEASADGPVRSGRKYEQRHAADDKQPICTAQLVDSAPISGGMLGRHPLSEWPRIGMYIDRFAWIISRMLRTFRDRSHIPKKDTIGAIMKALRDIG